ncbi:hypothetical protein LIER_20504 [Lithospermum erythrorhizon]|uniref:RNase H type-1 domain-containing protein n=1 Tax=Lithospermum erythrorhizon TaxID=34254 RepID=A0AAV3QMT1_LITER
MAYTLWKHRNDMLFNDVRRELSKLWEAGIKLADDFKEAQQPTLLGTNSREAGETVAVFRWQQPARGLVKVNVDASFRKEENYGAAGVVGRHGNGEFLGAGFQRNPHVNNPLLAEGLAMRTGLEFAWKNKWRRVIMESDSKEFVLCLQGEYKTPNKLQLIVGDILYLAQDMEVQFHHISRVSNNVAHTVAHWDHGVSMEMQWLHHPPYWLIVALLHDIVFLFRHFLSILEQILLSLVIFMISYRLVKKGV